VRREGRASEVGPNSELGLAALGRFVASVTSVSSLTLGRGRGRGRGHSRCSASAIELSASNFRAMDNQAHLMTRCARYVLISFLVTHRHAIVHRDYARSPDALEMPVPRGFLSPLFLSPFSFLSSFCSRRYSTLTLLPDYIAACFQSLLPATIITACFLPFFN
jgi:hypothetical protein